jgi:penicillin-binding protein 1A
VSEPIPPAGLSHENGDWVFIEYSKGAGVSSLGLDSKSGNSELPANDEKKKILDLFKN